MDHEYWEDATPDWVVEEIIEWLMEKQEDEE